MSKIQFFSNLTVFKNNEGYYSASVENKTEKGEWYKKYLDVRFIDKNVDLENGDIIKCMGFFSLSMNKKTEEKYFALVVEKFEYVGNVFEAKENKEIAEKAKEKKKTAPKQTKQVKPAKSEISFDDLPF